jgi:DNA-binding LacI/PurR family transcriptional regulator
MGALEKVAGFTQEDVARQAGVSRATVSAVINNTRYVSPEIKEKVRTVMEAMAYEPNAIARGLKFSRTFTLGLLVPNLQSPFWPTVVQGIEDEARRNKYNVIFYSTAEDEAQELEGMNLFLGRRVDGMLAAPAGHSHAEYLARLAAHSMPIVLLDRRLENSGLSSISVDNLQGSYHAVRHLLEVGRRRIGVTSIPETISTGRERIAGYEKALTEFGMELDPNLVRTASFSIDASVEQTMRLFELSEPPDAIFATNHSAVIGALQAIRSLGKAVPEEVAVIGFDDYPWMSLLDPPLTTISQPMYRLGKLAAELLIQTIEGQVKEPKSIILETNFMHRKSCGC